MLKVEQILDYFRNDLIIAFLVLAVVSFGGAIFIALMSFCFDKILKNNLFLLHKIKLRNIFVDEKHTKPELRHQIVSIFLSGILGYGLVFLVVWLKLDRLYYDIYEFGFIWLGLNLVIMFALADLYLYIVHRFLHTRIFYKIHQNHHSFVLISVFSAYSFSVIELAIHTWFLAFFIILFPTNLFNILIFTVVTVVYNFYLHCGYEFSGFRFPFNFLNTATLHQSHHTEYKYNYGFYTNIWDRLFGTFRK